MFGEQRNEGTSIKYLHYAASLLGLFFFFLRLYVPLKRSLNFNVQREVISQKIQRFRNQRYKNLKTFMVTSLRGPKRKRNASILSSSGCWLLEKGVAA
jgi:hypothetical protein